jgi:hypothetical protein
VATVEPQAYGRVASQYTKKSARSRAIQRTKSWARLPPARWYVWQLKGWDIPPNGVRERFGSARNSSTGKCRQRGVAAGKPQRLFSATIRNSKQGPAHIPKLRKGNRAAAARLGIPERAVINTGMTTLTSRKRHRCRLVSMPMGEVVRGGHLPPGAAPSDPRLKCWPTVHLGHTLQFRRPGSCPQEWLTWGLHRPADPNRLAGVVVGQGTCCSPFAVEGAAEAAGRPGLFSVGPGSHCPSGPFRPCYIG